MYFYGLLFLIGFSLTILGIYFPKYDKLCFILFSITLVYLACFRYGISTDYFTYVKYYENSPKVGGNRGNFEFGYFTLNRVLATFHIFSGFLFAITTIIVIRNIYFALKNFQVNKICGLFIYFSLFYFVNIFNLVRHGVAASFCLLAFSSIVKNKKKNAIIFLLMGSLFHNLSLIFLPIVCLSKYKYNILIIAITIFFSYLLFNGKIIFNLLYVINAVPENYYRYIYSYIGVNNTSTLGIGTIILIGLFIFFTINKNRLLVSGNIMSFIVSYNMIFFSILAILFLWSIPTALERLLNVLKQGLIILLPYCFRTSKNYSKLITILAIFAICLLFYGQSMFLQTNSGRYAHYPYQWNLGYNNY